MAWRGRMGTCLAHAVLMFVLALPASGQAPLDLLPELAPTPCDFPIPARLEALSLERAPVPGCTVPRQPWTVPVDHLEPGRAFLASLLLPGLGQWTLEQRRWALYGLIEVLGWGRFIEQRSTGFDLRDDYRDLAWTAARSALSAERVDGDFEYYERVASFLTSGAFDIDRLRPGIQPELDRTTFNGQIWELAKGIFFPSDSVPAEGDPAYERALAYYVERSYDDRFLWDWTDRPAERTEYQGLIRRSDDALRSSTAMIGVVIANHVASAVDAYLSARLRVVGEAAFRLRFHPVSSPGSMATGVGVTLTLIH
jgi:hypothetical protein